MGNTEIIKKQDPEFQNHFRAYARKDVELKALVSIKTDEGKLHTVGSAVVRDLSLKGARLGQFELESGSFPACAFKIRIQVQAGPEDNDGGLGGICRPVRFVNGDEFELAVEFEDLWIGSGG